MLRAIGGWLAMGAAIFVVGFIFSGTALGRTFSFFLGPDTYIFTVIGIWLLAGAYWATEAWSDARDRRKWQRPRR